MSAEIVSINSTKIPPKTFKVRHKGLHGTVTFDPDTKKWIWEVKLQVTLPQTGTEPSEDKARDAIKRVLDIAAVSGNRTRTTD